ncbi:MAG: phosphate/phosphite/phosphonate ABC transporter substrate-binding protein [Dehalococcoidia bacterium]|nr:hypothetical protein [Dehalococcoidia bacterium]MBF8304607.1 hypothetical protein [Dehalococcoidia bacterium]MDO8636228.1 phosphate/phosphite/phosphonate ABC transporter substrate-binding protein [Dehalococcoidia bacterium]
MRVFNFVLLIVIVAAFGGIAWLIMVDKQGNFNADLKLSLLQPVSGHIVTPNQVDKSRLRFAVAPVLSPLATAKNYETLATYLGEKLGRPVELVQGKSYTEINAMVRDGDVSLAFVCSGAFVIGRREFGMEALVTPVVNGQKTYNSYLVVPTRSTAKTWGDLRQKTFAFTDPLSNTGRIVPVYVLSQMGETPEKFFKSTIFTYGHDKSIQAVADSLVDGAAVDSLVYDFIVKRDPALAARTKIIWKSPPYGINPMVVNPDLSPQLRRQFESIFLGMSSDTKGMETLKYLGIDTFTKPDVAAYDAIEEMIRVTGFK